MSKIKLLVKTNSNINELKRKEIQAIDWSSFPYDEQMQFVNADTYSKLTSEGRYHIDLALNDYTSKPVEFWNVVAEYDNTSLASTLWRSASLNTKGIMLENHPVWFKSYQYSYKIDSGEIQDDKITTFIQTHSDGFQYEKPGYWFLADPHISIDEFNAPFRVNSSDYTSLLHYIYFVLEDDCEHDDYPVLVHNHMLKSAGYEPICDLSPEFLLSRDACNSGTIIARKWIQVVTEGKKNFITWDEAVNYIRTNPELFNNDEIMEHLTWWWTNSIMSGSFL